MLGEGFGLFCGLGRGAFGSGRLEARAGGLKSLPRGG